MMGLPSLRTLDGAQGRDPAADMAGLEQQIDSIVFDVYGLTPTEVQVVQGSTECLTKELEAVTEQAL